MSPREIDQLIAEHCMGFVWVNRACNFLLPLERATYVLARRGSIGGRIDGDEDRIGNVPGYSTDPATSKQLRDHMRAKGWEYSLHGSRVAYAARFWRDDQTWKFGSEQGITEEMAVGLAALSAVGKPVSK